MERNKLLELIGPIDDNQDVIRGIKIVIDLAETYGIKELPVTIESMKKIVEIVEVCEIMREELYGK